MSKRWHEEWRGPDLVASKLDRCRSGGGSGRFLVYGKIDQEVIATIRVAFDEIETVTRCLVLFLKVDEARSDEVLARRSRN